ncbi:MAG: hypothetical protein ABSA41_08390 [Terriglobia bacterium]
MSPRTDKVPAHFKTMAQVDVPQGRNGKHKQIVSTILKDLDKLKDGSAIKVPLAELVESKEKVRSALNRATRKAGRTVATASDAGFLYVWNVSASRQSPQRSN